MKVNKKTKNPLAQSLYNCRTFRFDEDCLHVERDLVSLVSAKEWGKMSITTNLPKILQFRTECLPQPHPS